MPKIADELARLNTTLVGLGHVLSDSDGGPAAQDVAAAPPAGPAAPAAPASDTDVMATLAMIAREHLGMVTLEERKRDRLDFYDVGVLSVAAALRAAYDVGFAAAASQTAH